MEKHGNQLTKHHRQLLEDFVDAHAGWSRASLNPEQSKEGRAAEYVETLRALRKCLRHAVLRKHPLVADWLSNEQLFGERKFLRSVRDGLEKDVAGISWDICFLCEVLVDCDEDGRIPPTSWCVWDEEDHGWRLKPGKSAEMARRHLIKELKRSDFVSLHIDESQRQELLERFESWKYPGPAMTNFLKKAGIESSRRRRKD